MVKHCSGIEVCGGLSCRLWNGSFTSDTTINATKTCRRYKKALPQITPDDFSQTFEAENYSTTNDITDSPTPTFATNPTLQERSESFTTRVSSETTTSGNFLSSSNLLPVDSTTDSHVTTQTVIDDLTSIGNVSTATVDIHSIDSATDKTTNSLDTTQTVIDDLTSNGNVSTATVEIHSTDSTTDKTTDNHGSTHTVIDNLTSIGNVSTATVDNHSIDSATDKTTNSNDSSQTLIDNLTSNGNVSTATVEIHSTDSATDKTTDSQGSTQTVIDNLTSNGNVSTATVDIHSTDSSTGKTTDSHGSTQTVIDNLTSNGNVSTATVDIHSTDSATDKTNPISLASTDSAITLSHSGVSIQMEATDSTTSLPDLTTPIQDSSTSTESTNPNQDWVMTFTTSNGSSKEVPCHHGDGYSWIVIQRRYDGSILFNKTWREYENGFGNPMSDLWLGNYYISELTSAGYTVLRIDLTSYDGDKRQIEYNFHVENQTNKYRLHVSERNVSGIDSFSASNMEMFTTFDNDNDKLRAKNCAVDMFSGWWYADTNSCTEANLNGVHWPQVVNDKRGVTWVKWLGTWTLKETRMMIRKP